MDIRKIKKLIDLIDETGVSEIEIREGEESVRISRQYLQPATPMATVVAPAIPQPQAKADEIEKPKAAAAAQSATPSGYTLKSPMVGTVFLSAKPGAKPFVEVGQHIEAGTVLCLIEAMKMYNQIEADKAGVVSARLIENGQPVEYDQPLFIIE